MNTWLPWGEATRRALYGPGGFYHRLEGPAGHFRTSVHASPLFARALAGLAEASGLDMVVDVGSGRGELLVALRRAAPRLRLYGVDVAARPEGLPPGIGWGPVVPDGAEALLVANEWLDNVPVDVVEVGPDGRARTVEVETATGRERLGAPVTDEDAAWLERWWPLGNAPEGARAEVGAPRDRAWAGALGRLGRGLAIAVDYGHLAGARPLYGTLAGYRQGRLVPPVPDGTCDVTCHVAMDAVASAGEATGAGGTVVTLQRQALRALGVRGGRPPYDLARTDPEAYLGALRDASEAGELTARGGLGDFHWLVQGSGMAVPQTLAARTEDSGTAV